MILFFSNLSLEKNLFCRSFPPISLKKGSQQIRLAHMSLPRSSPIFLTNHAWIQMAGHARHSFCAWLTESLRKPQLQSHCSLWCFLTAAVFLLCPHPLPAGLFLAIMIYVALLHSIFNCGTLPYLIPVTQFFPSSVITGVLASHPAPHLTAKLLELVHPTSRSCRLQDINSHSWSIPYSSSHLHLRTSAWSWHLSAIPLNRVKNPISMCHSGCIKVIW